MVDGLFYFLVIGKDSIEVNVIMEYFLLKIVNVFVLDQVVIFFGDMDGGFYIIGDIDWLLVNGDLVLDSVLVFVCQVGVWFMFDNCFV